MRNNLLAGAAAIALLALSAKAVSAQNYDSGGFEAPRYSTTATNSTEQSMPGDLRGQDGATAPSAWFYAVGIGQTPNSPTVTTASATVVATNPMTDPVGTYGSQDVKVSRISSDTRWAPTYIPTVTPAGIVKISWAMNVATPSDSMNYGPFFGVEAYSATSVRLGMVGIDSSTGALLYFNNSGTGMQGLAPFGTVTPGTGWNTYEMDLNYTTQQYSVYLNNTLEVTTPFETTGTAAGAQTQFQNAPITTTLSQSGGNAAGTAYFDNYVISTVPEPTTIGLAVFGLLTLNRRRMT